MLTLLLVLCYYSCQTDEEGVKLPNQSHRESGCWDPGRQEQTNGPLRAKRTGCTALVTFDAKPAL